jgi:hypothetical protein
MSFELVLWMNLRKGALLASEAVSAYNKILQLGLLDLEQDLQNAKTYDHDNRSGNYEDKNVYFNRANFLGISLLRQNATGFSKMYYWNMLNAINNYERKAKKPLNKGMVCGNLGVSSLAEGDLDGGLAYLAWAMREDRAWITGNPENSIFASPLYEQFAKGTNRGGISQFGRTAPWIMLEKALEKYNVIYKEKVNVSSVFKELEDSPEHRALFEGAIWTIHRNLCLLREENDREIYQNDNNVFTRLRLFDGIVNLCRFIELRMRTHEKPPKEVRTLGNLIHYIFDKQSWFASEVKPNYAEPQTAKDFNDLVETTLKLNAPARSVLLLWLTRNYSVHICDPNAPSFFEKIDQIFDELIALYVYYLKSKKLM